ncbi:MAG: hypothetical protein H7101_04820 [Deinococcales bacterium]|nr:hypothetical protein [Chitinophagaceae bacterium]
MKLHSFLSRIALLCNILFIYCWLIQKTTVSVIANKDVNAVILILGYLTSPFLNMAVNIWWLILLTKKQQPLAPTWLLRTNLTLFFFQVFVLIMA